MVYLILSIENKNNRKSYEVFKKERVCFKGTDRAGH